MPGLCFFSPFWWLCTMCRLLNTFQPFGHQSCVIETFLKLHSSTLHAFILSAHSISSPIPPKVFIWILTILIREKRLFPRFWFRIRTFFWGAKKKMINQTLRYWGRFSLYCYIPQLKENQYAEQQICLGIKIQGYESTEENT